MRVLIVGCGYVGVPLGASLARQGHHVVGVRRTAGAEAALRAAGIEPVVADITRPATLAALPGPFEWVVNCVASGGGGLEEYRQVYLGGAWNLLRWLRTARPRAVVYTSSTSVYGQQDGAEVTEISPTAPDAATAAVLTEAEALWSEAARQHGIPAVILRVAAIYGPERGYWFKQFLSGTARLEGEGQRWLNMIHRDDVGGAIAAALARGRPGQIYNAVDDEPVRQRAFFAWLAERLGRNLPPTLPVTDAPPRKRGLANRRVSNHKLKTELGYTFRYPTFREGYADAIAQALRAAS